MPLTFLRITQRTVLWGLVLGFGMVVVLLGLAELVAVRDTRAIRKSAAGLVKEQLLSARLLHEVQVEENTLTEVLHASPAPRKHWIAPASCMSWMLRIRHSPAWL